MYVCGRGTDTFGTILPSVFDLYVQNPNLIAKFFVIARSENSKNEVLKKILEIQTFFKKQFPVEVILKSSVVDREFLTSKDIHCAIVATPDSTHFSITKLLLESGIHCLVVKPLTPDLKSSKTLAELARLNKLLGMVEFHKRFDHANLKIKDIVQQGLLGSLDHIIVKYSQRRSVPTIHFKEWAHETNIFQYLGVHYVDLIHFFTNATIQRVSSVASGTSLNSRGINTPDSIITHICWVKQDGQLFKSVHFTSWIDPLSSPAMSNQRIEIVGDKGRINSDQMNRGLSVNSEDRGFEYINPYFNQLYQSIPGQGPRCIGYGPDSVKTFLLSCSDLLNAKMAFENIPSDLPTFEHTLISSFAIEASNKSLALNGEWV